MEWFADFARVSFGGISSAFDVSSVFCEFNINGNLIQIKWYGVIIALGFTLAALFGGRIAYTWRMNLSKMIDVLIYGTLGGIVGARAYYVIFEWDYYSAHPGEIFEIWNGGLAIYGGIIGGILAGFITCKLEKLNFLNLLDLVGMSLLIGQGIGRWGNYANQEAFGTFTNANFGMMSDKVKDYIILHPEKYGLRGVADISGFIEENNLFVHPTFFYEFVWCMAGFGILYLILKKFRKFSGQIFLCYGIWYGLGRAMIEGLRTDSLYIGTTGIRVSQALSICIVVVCTVVLVTKLLKLRKNPQPIEGVDFFPADAAKLLSEIKAEKAEKAKGTRKSEKVLIAKKGEEEDG
jgi:phosphatidylglycerol:prolipoprotein diacylglycerol transferase